MASVPESRKTVTVVFIDVADSTSLGEKLDPESVRGLMSRYFELASTVLERHGGAVEKFIGDAVMAVFGIPRVHEDDALRAVRAARAAGDREVASGIGVPRLGAVARGCSSDAALRTARASRTGRSPRSSSRSAETIRDPFSPTSLPATKVPP